MKAGGSGRLQYTSVLPQRTHRSSRSTTRQPRNRRREDRSRWFRGIYAIGLWGDSHYVRIFFRGVVLEGLGITVIKTAVHGHLAGMLVAVFLLRYAASATMGQRVDAHRDPAVDRDLHQYRAQLLFGKAIADRASQVQLELLQHLAMPG